MSQLFSLFYKNFKITTRQRNTTIFQFFSPMICILCVLLLQILGRAQADKTNIKPPIDIPFNGFYPINFPMNLFNSSAFGSKSCLRINKYGFTEKSDDLSRDFVNQYIGFQKLSGLRNHVCKRSGNKPIMSPSFNQTTLQTSNQVQEEILKEMENRYGVDIINNQFNEFPSDGYYLFENANKSKVTATIFSNNMNVQLYHRANMQTQAIFAGFPVSLLDSHDHRRIP